MKYESLQTWVFKGTKEGKREAQDWKKRIMKVCLLNGETLTLIIRCAPTSLQEKTTQEKSSTNADISGALIKKLIHSRLAETSYWISGALRWGVFRTHSKCIYTAKEGLCPNRRDYEHTGGLWTRDPVSPFFQENLLYIYLFRYLSGSSGSYLQHEGSSSWHAAS